MFLSAFRGLTSSEPPAVTSGKGVRPRRLSASSLPSPAQRADQLRSRAATTRPTEDRARKQPRGAPLALQEVIHSAPDSKRLRPPASHRTRRVPQPLSSSSTLSLTRVYTSHSPSLDADNRERGGERKGLAQERLDPEGRGAGGEANPPQGPAEDVQACVQAHGRVSRPRAQKSVATRFSRSTLPPSSLTPSRPPPPTPSHASASSPSSPSQTLPCRARAARPLRGSRATARGVRAGEGRGPSGGGSAPRGGCGQRGRGA